MEPFNTLLVLIIVSITFVLWLIETMFLTTRIEIKNLSIYSSYEFYGK